MAVNNIHPAAVITITANKLAPGLARLPDQRGSIRHNMRIIIPNSFKRKAALFPGLIIVARLYVHIKTINNNPRIPSDNHNHEFVWKVIEPGNNINCHLPDFHNKLVPNQYSVPVPGHDQ